MSNLTLLPNPILSSLSLTTPPGTDIWRKPPTHDAFNAPIQYTALPLSSLKSARVTVKADWKTKFDQGGLCLVLPNGGEGKGQSEDGSEKVGGGRQWVKTGVEFMDGKAHVSTVACDRWVSFPRVSRSWTMVCFFWNCQLFVARELGVGVEVLLLLI